MALALGLLAAGCEVKAADSPLATNPRYSGTPFMHVWDADSHGGHIESHCVVQDPRTGMIYVGNANGVLEFDGVRWRLITTPDGEGQVTSLCVDRRGRIWGCSFRTIFRLEPDARGELRAHSMRPHLPATYRQQNFAFRIVATSHGVYACDRGSLIFFGDGDGPAEAWRVAEGSAQVVGLWQIDDEPYVQLGIPASRILRRRGERFEEVPSLTQPVLAARTEPDGAWQLSTVQGIQWWNGTDIVRVERPLSGDQVLQSVFLPDGRIALGTVNLGLVICDREGRVLQKIGRHEGLPSNQIRGLATDRQGGLWTAQPGGIVRLQIDSPYARHGPTQGLEGSVGLILRHRGELYVGGSEGVFRRGMDGRFRAQPKLPGQILTMVSHDDWLFVTSNGQLSGLAPGPGDSVRVLERRHYWGLLPLSGPLAGWYAYGSRDGLRWARFVGDKWIAEGPLLSAPKHPPTVRLESPAGVVWTWAQSPQGPVAWRVDFRGGLHPHAPVQVFGAAEGIPDGPINMFVLGGDVVSRVHGELRRFDEKAGRFVPETRVTGVEGYSIANAYLSPDDTLWLQAGEPTREFRRALPEPVDPANPAKGRRWRAEPLSGERLPHLVPATLFPGTFFPEDATQTLWMSGSNVLLSYDLTWQRTRASSPPIAVVRRIETDAGYLVAASDSPGVAVLPSALPPEQNALRISFAAPAYVPDQAGVVHTEYRTRLDGVDRGWTPWSRQAERNLGNLPWRDLTFRVQARDDQGRIGPEASVEFSIRPPWWATWWTRAGYLVVGLAGITAIVRWRTRVLQRQANRLESVVAHRTYELAERNEQLAVKNAELGRLHRLELDEKIAAQLSEEKARLEVLRYQLNPHFLYNSLNSIYGLLFENVRDAGEMVLRLSEFCRATLSGSSDELPTLGSELAALRTYLEVEKVRWSEKLQVEFDVAPEAEGFRVPSFLLLPLVENAIKYGGETSRDVLAIRIRASCFDVDTGPAGGARSRTIVIEVANTGEWLPASRTRPNSTGIGLENLRQRLGRYFPNAHEFSTEAGQGWVVARLRLTGSAVLSPSGSRSHAVP